MALYDFKIIYIQGKENITADALNKRANYINKLKLELAALLRKEGDKLVYRKLVSIILATIEVELTKEQKKEIIKIRYNNKSVGH
jgi:hypothetical protein